MRGIQVCPLLKQDRPPVALLITRLGGCGMHKQSLESPGAICLRVAPTWEFSVDWPILISWRGGALSGRAVSWLRSIASGPAFVG